LGEFSPLDRFFSLGSFVKTTELAKIFVRVVRYSLVQQHTNAEKIYQMENRPNGHKIYQHRPLCTRPTKIHPNWDFWFEKIPSGNPDLAYFFHGKNFVLILPQNGLGDFFTNSSGHRAAVPKFDLTHQIKSKRHSRPIKTCQAQPLFILCSY
jgi:hypothetical protein